MIPARIRTLLRHSTGLDLTQSSVNQAVKRRMAQCRIAQWDDYLARVMTSHEELNALIDLVVVPETWFFRDPEAFAAACAHTRERLAQGYRAVRMLSVPCATGEEPYSLAMALVDAGFSPGAFSIDAIDISAHAIEEAQRGIYHRKSFRSKDLGFRDRHFTMENEAHRLHEEIRSLVNFRVGSLFMLDSASQGRYDIIFCRNLLIYFDEPTQQTAIRTLHNLLQDDGVLFAGYAEAASFVRHGFSMLPTARAFGLKKKESRKKPQTRNLFFEPPKPSRLPQATVRRRTALPAQHPVRPQSETPAFAVTTADQIDHDSLLEQAIRLADAGEVDSASEQLLAYLRQVPDSAQACFMLGLLYERKSRDDAASEYLRRAVYLDPNHYDALCHLALHAERDGNHERATHLKQRAARVFRRSAEEESKK